MKPVCKNCGDSGNGVEFSIFSKYGFGTFCVRCEDLVSPDALRVIQEAEEE
jgi:hypothetical protein